MTDVFVPSGTCARKYPAGILPRAVYTLELSGAVGHLQTALTSQLLGPIRPTGSDGGFGLLDLLELLESFNRKERFFLVRQALGNFQLSDEFRRELGDAISVAIPRDAFAAMDYHLEWLTAALYAHECGDLNRIFDNPQQQVIKGNQQDTDLLVAFQDDERHHIVLVEAKGATGWTKKQMRSKADRLTQIFGSDGNRYSGVMPHFCLASPCPPKKLRASEWPRWMSKDDGSYYWLRLNFPEDRVMVTRCDVHGNQSAKGNYFEIIPAGRPPGRRPVKRPPH